MWFKANLGRPAVAEIREKEGRIQMLGKCVFAAFLTLIPLAARADQWIVLNGGDRTCEFPRAPVESPAASERYARDRGIFSKTEVSRNDDGTIRMVSVQVVTGGRETAMVFSRIDRLAKTSCPK